MRRPRRFFAVAHSCFFEFPEFDRHFFLLMAMLELGEKYGQWYEIWQCRRKSSCPKDRDERKLKNLIVNADDLGWTEGINRGSRMPTGADW